MFGASDFGGNPMQTPNLEEADLAKNSVSSANPVAVAHSFDGADALTISGGLKSQNPFTQFDSLKLEQQTEEEAIALIQSLQHQLVDLRTQLAHKDEEMATLTAAQAEQVSTYKSQIANLTRQIELFERKFEQMDQDRAQMSKRTAQITQENIAKIRHMEAEKDSMIVDLQEQVLALSQKVKEHKQTAEKRLNECKKEAKEARRDQRESDKERADFMKRLEELEKENEHLRSLMELKEAECEQVVKGCKKEVAQGEKAQRQLETRLKDVNQALAARSSEVEGYQSTLLSIEQLQKKARVEVDKVKRERDEFKKQRDECFRTQLPQMEQKLQQQRDEIKVLQKDVEKQKQKVKQAERDKIQALQSLEQNQGLFRQVQERARQNMREMKKRARLEQLRQQQAERAENEDEEDQLQLELNEEIAKLEQDLENWSQADMVSEDLDAEEDLNIQDPTIYIVQRLAEVDRLEQEIAETQKKMDVKDKKIKKLKEDNGQQNGQFISLLQRLVKNFTSGDHQAANMAALNEIKQMEAISKNNMGVRRGGSRLDSTPTQTSVASSTNKKGTIAKKKVPRKETQSKPQQKSKKTTEIDQESEPAVDVDDIALQEQSICTMDIESLNKTYPRLNQLTIEESISACEQITSHIVSITSDRNDLQNQLDKLLGEQDEAKRLSEEQAQISAYESLLKLQSENKKLKSRTDFLLSNLNQLHSRHNKLSLQAFNQLHNIKFKFQGNERITAQVNFDRVNQIPQEFLQLKELEDMQQNNNDHQQQPGQRMDIKKKKKDVDDEEEDAVVDEEAEMAAYQRALKDEFQHLLDLDQTGAIRDAQVLELVSMLSEVTNILHFDLKCLELKNSQIEDLKSRVGEVERNKVTEHELFKQRISEDIAEVKREYEQKFAMYQTQHSELQHLNEELREQNSSLSQREQETSHKLVQHQQELARMQESQKNFKDTINVLERQNIDATDENNYSRKAIASLSVQKNVLRVKLLCLERNNLSTIKALHYLTGKYQTQEQKRLRKAAAGGSDQAAHLEKMRASLDESIKKPLRALRFRKAVIAVLFANRIKKATSGKKNAGPRGGIGGRQQRDQRQLNLDFSTINALKGGLLALVEHYAKNVNQEKIDKIINDLDWQDQQEFSVGPITDRTANASEEGEAMMTMEDALQKQFQQQLVMLVCVLNPRDFFNRHLFCLEDQLEQYSGLHQQLEASHRLLITQLNQKITERDLQAQKMKDDVQQMSQLQEQSDKRLSDKLKSYESLHQKYKKKKEEFKAIKYELQNETVPLEEFQRVQDSNEQFRQNQKEMNAKFDELENRIQESKRELEQIENEKMHAIESSKQSEVMNQELTQKIYIKEEKIQSLETLLQLRDKTEQSQIAETMTRLEELISIQAKDKALISNQQKELEKLEQEKQKLLKDNVLLLQVNNEVKQKVMEIEVKLDQDHQQKILEKETNEKEANEKIDQMETKLSEIQTELLQLKDAKLKVEKDLAEKAQENEKLAQALERLTTKLEQEQHAQEAMMLSESQINRSISQAEMLLQPQMQGVPPSYNLQANMTHNYNNNFEATSTSQQLNMPLQVQTYPNQHMMSISNVNSGMVKMNSLTSAESLASLPQPQLPQQYQSNSRTSKLQSLVPGRIIRRNTGRTHSNASSNLGTQRSLSRGAPQVKPQSAYGVSFVDNQQLPQQMLPATGSQPQTYQSNTQQLDLDQQPSTGYPQASNTLPSSSQMQQIDQVNLLIQGQPHDLDLLGHPNMQSQHQQLAIGSAIDMTEPTERSLDLSATQKSMVNNVNMLQGLVSDKDQSSQQQKM